MNGIDVKRDNSRTLKNFCEAGVAPGMRILELGCGSGEVTELLASLVGPAGSVLAVDRSHAPLELARQRLVASQIENVQLITLDIDGSLSALGQFPPESFDAVVGRRVLMYLQQPAQALQRITEWLKPSGLAVFEELDLSMVPARAEPLKGHDQATDWLKAMLIAEGANPKMGFSLPTTYAQAGLKFVRIRGDAVIQGQGTQFPLSQLLDMTKERIVGSGVASRNEVESVTALVLAESRDLHRVYVSEMSFCAWATKR